MSAQLQVVPNDVLQGLDELLNSRIAGENTNALVSFLDIAEGHTPKEVQAVLDAKVESNKDLGSRISEIRAVYTATINKVAVDFSGYHKAIKTARAGLKELGIQANGKPAKTASEKAEGQRQRFITQAIKDGLSGAEADHAWEVEQAKAMSDDDIQEEADAVLDFLQGRGFDYGNMKTICQKAAAMIAEVMKADKEAKKAGTVVTMQAEQ